MFKADKAKVEEKIISKFISLLDKGHDADYCFAKFPVFKSYRSEIEQYLDALSKIRDFRSVKPSKKFEKSALEKIYQNTQKTEESYFQKNLVSRGASKPARPFLKPVIAFISTFLFLSFSYTGTVFASTNSIPGDILYSVKISAEHIQTSFTPPSGQGPLHLRFLNRRMAEAAIILNENINISDEELNKLLGSIDLEYKRCNEHHYLSGQQNETLNIEINGIKTKTQMRMRKMDGTGSEGMGKGIGGNGMGNNNNGGQCTSSTETSVSGNSIDTTASDNSTETTASDNSAETTASGNSTETTFSNNSAETTASGNSTKPDSDTVGASNNDGTGFDNKNGGK
ncbi:MAG: DUF5667 domain-containing protein [Actinomycetota bacterium]